MQKIEQKIVPFLWFDNNGEEAIAFYTSIFENSKILEITRYGDAGPGPKGTMMSARFILAGQEFSALNGGPMFKFNEAVSFLVKCDTQEEIDYFWAKLTDGGQEQPCGWLKDKYGLSWQVAPSILGRMLRDADTAKADRVMKAMMTMKKIIIRDLEEAYAGGVHA